METLKLTKEEMDAVLMIVEKHLDWIADCKSENFEGWETEEIEELKNEWEVCSKILKKIKWAMLKWEKSRTVSRRPRLTGRTSIGLRLSSG